MQIGDKIAELRAIHVVQRKMTRQLLMLPVQDARIVAFETAGFFLIPHVRVIQQFVIRESWQERLVSSIWNRACEWQEGYHGRTPSSYIVQHLEKGVAQHADVVIDQTLLPVESWVFGDCNEREIPETVSRSKGNRERGWAS